MENNKIPTYLFALGGIEEIGRNMYIVEHDDEIWIIDSGNKFVNKDIYLGFNCMICDFSYLLKNKDKIKGMIVTHGHEDHIGGIPFLLKEVPIPNLYAGRLTLNIIQRKIKKANIKTNNCNFIPISDDFVICNKKNADTILSTYLGQKPQSNNILLNDTKYFIIDFYRVCHSIPDSFGICFKTPNGIICTTGDFRFDFLTSGDESDINKMSKIGHRDVSMLMCECTNAPTPGFSVSEKYIIDELRKIIIRCEGRIFVTIFASNLHRIEEVIVIAVQNNRKIALCGHSMINNVEAAIDEKMLHVPEGSFIEIKDVDRYNPNEVLVLATGSQGEEMAALNQMASNNHQFISLHPTDTIIFSSNPIPGNYENVEKLINKLYHTGVNIVISGGESKIHSSGHATQTEIELLIKLINPTYLIPIHGEYKMLTALKKDSGNIGIPESKVLQITNGQKIMLLDRVASITNEKIEIKDILIDGSNINSNKEETLKYRKMFSTNGIINVILMIDRKKHCVYENPSLTVRGSFYAPTSGDLLNEISRNIKTGVSALLAKDNNASEDTINNVVNEITILYTKKYRNKTPYVNSKIFFVDDLIG